MPKVSVIIPFYNSQRYIGEAISSILKQTYTDYEIIAVDDGSTDRSAEIVKSFGNGIRYFYHPNMGVARTMNRGMEVAAGKYLAFLESDDIWYPEKLEKQVAILDSYPHIGIVNSDIEYIESDGRRLTRILVAAKVNDAYLRLFVKGFILLPSSIMIRKEVYANVGGMDEGFIGACLQDYEWAARLCEIANIYHFNKPLFLYRLHPGNTPAHVVEHNTALFIEKLMERFGSNRERKRYLIVKKIGFLSDMGKTRIKNGQVVDGRRYLWESVMLSIQSQANFKVLVRTVLRIMNSYIK